jgi:hypothetical protein
MESTKLIFEDKEKIIYEILGLTNGFPEWILIGGDQIGKCFLTYDTDGSYKPTTMYYGARLDLPETKIFIIKVKNPIRTHEVYGLAFVGKNSSEFACYNEGHWEILLQEVLARFPNLNQISELKYWGKKHAVPGLVFDTNCIGEKFEASKTRAMEIMSAQLQDFTVLGYIERESIFQWNVGIDYHNQKHWVPIRMLWNKIKDNTQSIAQATVQCQEAGLFDHNVESSRSILTKVIQPFCDTYNITRIAQKHNVEKQLQAQQQWLSIQLSNLVRESFVEAFENE